MKKLVNILILLGALGFVGAIIQKICYIELPLVILPTTLVKFSILSLLLAIALSVRKT